ncbi:MAG: SDR family oxidoreductase [Chryseobacterium sp.]|jgi:NAD(P)-dependent dehydrogenase (short-subunit alcohol dehydrogenase family)|uniref:SDR family NAD(P)-dependent oxidoreductase n=1 Tax=Chryseobacterium sp. TaxID=1871047 RepID=UPI00282317F8|nr:SDR family oxidoreductase [Chryseobacterium sp.]MDR2235338.1 SDR family oxidoreductase [Chryseobacterium sp.]
MKRLENKTAIITGAGSGYGIGAETARLFAEEGASVVVTGRPNSKENLENLVKELTDKGCNAACIFLDVANEEQWEEAVKFTADTYGGIDILVNNAGTPGPRGDWGVTSVSDVDAIMGTNLTSQFLGIQKVLPFMEKAGAGSVVNVGSAAGVIAFPDVNPGYAASKGASRMLSKSAGVDLAKKNIRVNSVLPGLIATPMATHYTEDPEAMKQLSNAIPAGRAGQSKEIATAILFLASDEASYITATELIVDGGLTAI